MYSCTDVAYDGNRARVACVTFQQWGDTHASGEFVLDDLECQPYVPGQFYRRELPCLLAILDRLPASPDAAVVDGYVWLDEHGRKGLGAHLYDALGESVPIIGVAKTRFATATGATELLRGSSRRPLYISAAGMDQDAATDCIRRMHGKHRIPTLLSRVDRLSRMAV